MKQNFIKLFKTAIISLILLLFINVESKGQSPVIDFSYSPDTIIQGDTVTFTNLSTNINDSIIFIWELPYCIYNSHFENSISCFDTTTGIDETVKYRFLYALDYTITLTAVNKYNLNIIGTESKILKTDIGEADCEEEICSFLCNGDFETLDNSSAPPTARGQMGGYTQGWFNNGSPKATSDLFDRNSIQASGVKIPLNFAGYQETLHPNEHGYIGLLNYLTDDCEDPTNYREFVQQILTRKMNVGQDYVVGMYYALSSYSKYTNDNLGICLTEGVPIQEYSNEGIYCNGLLDSYGINTFKLGNQLHQTLKPQVKLSSSIPDRGVWNKLTGVVHATDSFNIITIGGFKNNDSTQNYPFPNGSVEVDSGINKMVCYIYIDSVFVYPLLKNKSQRDTICLASNITLTSSVMPPSTTFYTWSASIHGTGVDSITIKPKNDTVVICTAMDSYGCTMVDTFYIKIQYPLINITAENTCFGQPTNFSAHYQTCPDSIYAYSWDFGDGSPVSTLSNPSHTYASPGNYRACLTYTIYGGFMRSTCDSVQISNPPSLQVAGPNNDCDPIAEYTITNFQARGQYSYYSYGEWITIDSSSFIYSTGNGNLIVSYTNQQGCTVYDTVHIFTCCTKGGSATWANSTINIPDTITTDVCINGTIVINADITFSNVGISMGPEAKFVVNSGKKLTLDKAYVQAVCGYMWDGIYAENPTSRIVVIDTSTIKDAIHGIVSSNGGQIYLRKSFFRDNYYNVIIRNYNTTYNHPAYISGCRFIGADSLVYQPMHPQPTFIGIVIDSVGNENTGGSTNYYATIGDTIAGTTGGSIITNSKCNYFRKTGVGIFVKNSNAKIYNCYFSRENNTYGTGSAVYIQGKTLSGQQVNNVKHIVNIGGSNPKRIFVDSSYVGVYSDKNIDLKIIKNKFYNNLFGVVFAENNYNNGASNYNSVQINYNTFLTCNYSVYSASNNRCVTDVKYNRINDSTTSAGWYSYGILMNGSQQNSERAYIWNNNITSKGTGISALAFDSTISINYNFIKIPAYSSTTFGIQVQNCYPAIINNNVVTTPDSLYSYGISVEQSNSATVKCDSVRGLNFGIRFAGANLPGNFSMVKGNSFNKCTNGLVKTNAGIIGNQISSTNCSDNKWYNYPAGYSHTYTNASSTEVIFSRNITSGIYNPAINNNSGGGGPFTKLPGTSTLYVCGALPQGMMSSIQTNSTNDAVNLYESIASENNNYSLGNITAEYLAKQSLYKLMLNEPPLFASNVNMQQFKADNDNLSMGQITRAEFLLSNNDIVNAAILNNSAQPSNQIEEKLKMMIAYKIQLLKTDSLSANQLDDIRELAKQCPFELGTSVYFARAVISKYDLNIRYNNPCEYIGIIKNKMFEPSTPDGENTEVRHTDIRVMPNPANDKLCIELNLETSGNLCIFELYDLTGKKIISIILPHDKLNNINLNEMTEGAYIYKIIVNGNIAKTDKLIIIK